MSFAKRLRELRQERGLSRVELAGRAGLGPKTVRDYEQGLREPTLRSAFKLAEVLGVPVEDFKDGVAEDAGAPAKPLPKGRPRKPAPAAQETSSAGKATGTPARQKKPATGQGNKGKGKAK
ncbi:MAG: helix-turn-helix transcriptional regulator [Planctomycetes bacterium]|nr:helix-turn-helix transcriptional regulator [Planctomycetota bacterium]